MYQTYELFLSQAHYFSRADVALFGFHKWFKKMSDEERQHGQMLMDYVNKRGGTVSMTPTLDFPHGNKVCIIRVRYRVLAC
jgi:ferritin heavy chain